MQGDDDGLPAVSVLNDVQQKRTFLGVKRHEEEVVQNKQRTPFYFSEFRLNGSLGLCHFQRPQKFRGVCIKGADSGLACLVSQCGGQETLSCTGRTGDEEVLRLPDELQGGQPFHLVPVKSAAYCVVYLFRIGFVAE